jgi:hypothetical protein
LRDSVGFLFAVRMESSCPESGRQIDKELDVEKGTVELCPQHPIEPGDAQAVGWA